MRQLWSRVLMALCLVVLATAAKPYIDAMDHDIQIVNPQSFDAVIRKFRDDKVQCVLFYQKNADTKKMIDGWYNRVAKDLKGMVKVAALDCDESPLFCKDQNVKTFPTILIFPPNPLPATPYEGAMEEKPLTSALTRMIPNYNIKTVTAANIDEFLTTHIGIPKVFLFTNKKGHPTIYKALSNHFKKEMDFGIINESETALVSRFKVTKFPTIQVHRADKKPETYSKKELTYQGLYDFVNLYCETFAKGGGFDHSKNAQHSGSSGGSGAKEEAKPWLVQKVPEVTKASHGDVCFKGDSQGLCVIFLKNGGPLSPEEEAMLERLHGKFTSHLADRGANLRWMWMDMNVESEWAKLFDVSGQLPNVVVFNPHKRLRFTKLGEGTAATEDNIKALLDKIMGGDARFKMVPGQKLPEFANRAKKDEL